MATKKVYSLIRIVKNLIFLVPSFLSLIINLGKLIGYEIKIAGRSLILLVVLFICLGLLLTSTWLCLLAIIFVALTAYLSSLTALTAILALNLLLALLTALVMARIKEGLLFPETTKQIEKIIHNYRD